jgi:enamine deaminase RidA (YjgF/YER057c/UK114 family)
MHRLKMLIQTCGFAVLLSGIVPAYAQLKSVQPSNDTGSAMAVLVDETALVHTAQIFPLDKSGVLVGKGDINAQLAQVFKNIQPILKQTNSGLDRVVKMNIYAGSADIIPLIKKQLAVTFSGKNKPAVTYIINQFANGADVAIDLVAASRSKNKTVQYYNNMANFGAVEAKAAVLPAGGVTYISGQADKGDAKQCTQGTIKQLDASLKHLGIDKKNVVQLRAFMNNIADIAIVEKELSAYFETVPPLVYTQWISKEYEVEIELIAASPVATQKRDSSITFLDLPGMAHSPVYSKATQINNGRRIYFSEIYGSTPNNTAAQTEEMFTQLKALLTATGSDFNHLAKATYFHTDVAASAALGSVRPKYYNPHGAPGASKAMLKAMPEGKSVSFDMIGVVK